MYASYQLGIVYYLDEVYDSSIYFFQKALQNKTYGDMIVDYPDNTKGQTTDKNKYDVISSEIIYHQGVSYYYSRNLKEAYNNFDFCIKKGFMLGKSYLYRGSIYLESKQNQKACNDFLEAKKYGNVDVIDYLHKYCKTY